MNFALEKSLKAKRELRQRLAARPILEKLAMLDALRERSLTIGRARPTSASPKAGNIVLREEASQSHPNKVVKTKP